MEFITAIIQTNQLEAVKKELADMQVNLMTVTRVMEKKRERKVEEIYGRPGETTGLISKVQLDIAVNDNFADSIIKAIVKGARIDQASQDRIFVF